MAYTKPESWQSLVTAPSGTSATGVVTSAQAILNQFLSDYGLAALGDWAWQKMLRGESIEQISLEMRDTPTYQARFPAMQQLAKDGHAMSEAEYIAQEKSYTNIMHSYGLPSGFYDSPQDFAKFMTGNVSPAELNDRVKEYTAAVMGDTETLNQLRLLYDEVGHDGNPVGDLLAHYLDPTVAQPLLTQQLQAAQFASASSRSGFGQLTAAEAEQYGARAGTTAREGEQGFGALVNNRELMDALPGEAADRISREEQLGAAFGGNSTAVKKIEDRRRLRVAEGSGGGSFSTTQRGARGLGSSEV